jgi:hypothetical protein
MLMVGVGSVGGVALAAMRSVSSAIAGVGCIDAGLIAHNTRVVSIGYSRLYVMDRIEIV